MSDTNNLIKSAAGDIIAIISIWGLINNSYLFNNPYLLNNLILNKYYNTYYNTYYNNYNLKILYLPIYTTILGTGISIFMLKKYY